MQWLCTTQFCQNAEFQVKELVWYRQMPTEKDYKIEKVNNIEENCQNEQEISVL